jgi:hypothetical protein
LLIVAGIAVVAVVLLIGAGAFLRGRNTQNPGSSAVTGGTSEVPIERNVIGSPSAPLVLVEFSDFQ